MDVYLRHTGVQNSASCRVFRVNDQRNLYPPVFYLDRDHVFGFALSSTDRLNHIGIWLDFISTLEKL